MSIARTAKKSKPPPTAPPPALTRLTWREAMALLGVSQGSLYAMAKAGKIPAVPVGIEGWRFLKEPLEAWLKQQLSHGLEAQP